MTVDALSVFQMKLDLELKPGLCLWVGKDHLPCSPTRKRRVPRSQARRRQGPGPGQRYEHTAPAALVPSSSQSLGTTEGFLGDFNCGWEQKLQLDVNVQFCRSWAKHRLWKHRVYSIPNSHRQCGLCHLGGTRAGRGLAQPVHPRECMSI